MAELTPRFKLWLESEGRLVMSDYRLRLLELVEQSGSLSFAANELGLSYRRAWGKVKELEANLGMQFVRSEVGGSGGGHTQLTPAGRELLQAFRRFQDRAEAAVADAFRDEFTALLAQSQSPHDPAR